MAENKTLEKLRQQIEAAAALDAERIRADAKKRAEAITEGENERIRKEQGGTLLAKTSRYESDERKRVSECRYSAERKVLMHRNSLVDGLFDEIRADLEKFTASDEYEAHLAECARCADGHEKLGGDVLVYCRKADSALAEKVLKKYGVKTETDRNIMLGGLVFKYPEKGIYIDLTLDSAFEAGREAFSAKSEMQL